MSVRDYMDPALFMEVLFIAAEADTPEKKARVAWRASDYMWFKFPRYPVGMCREFNDFLQDQKFPKVQPPFTLEEVKKYGGVPDELPLGDPTSTS